MVEEETPMTQAVESSPPAGDPSEAGDRIETKAQLREILGQPMAGLGAKTP